MTVHGASRTTDDFKKQLEECIRLCLECRTLCERCAAECNWLEMTGTAKCTDLCRDCADICFLDARFMSRDSQFQFQTCAVCADVCEACADECGRMAGLHEGAIGQLLTRCAEACRRCAESCREMAAAADAFSSLGSIEHVRRSSRREKDEIGSQVRTSCLLFLSGAVADDARGEWREGVVAGWASEL